MAKEISSGIKEKRKKGGVAKTPGVDFYFFGGGDSGDNHTNHSSYKRVTRISPREKESPKVGECLDMSEEVKEARSQEPPYCQIDD